MPEIQYGSFEEALQAINAFNTIREQLKSINAHLLKVTIIFKVAAVGTLPSSLEVGDLVLLTIDNHLYLAIPA
jgi:hypothetical protein